MMTGADWWLWLYLLAAAGWLVLSLLLLACTVTSCSILNSACTAAKQLRSTINYKEATNVLLLFTTTNYKAKE